MTIQVTLEFIRVEDVRQWLTLQNVNDSDDVILDWDAHLRARIVGGVEALHDYLAVCEDVP